MALSEERRAGLWLAKLRGLARDHFDRTEGIEHSLPWGAALEHDGVWTALLEVSPDRTFGQALVLAARNEAKTLDLLVSAEAEHVARRAQLFNPAPSIWKVDGADLTPAEATMPIVLDTPDLRPDLEALLSIADVTVIVEHGSIIGECLGLEVARITGEGPEQRLDVGVGAYDQGAFAVINPGLTPNEALAEVVAQVLTHRRSEALSHPINRLVRERWVRHVLIADPGLVGLTSLLAVEPTTQRTGIKDVAIAAAVGADQAGERVLVACSVGIDLDAVPAAADLAEYHQVDRIMIVLPDRDRHALVTAVAAQSRRPIEFVTSPEPWPT